MGMILGNCKFPNNFFLILGNICCRYTLGLPLTYVFLINEFFFIINFS